MSIFFVAIATETRATVSHPTTVTFCTIQGYQLKHILHKTMLSQDQTDQILKVVESTFKY